MAAGTDSSAPNLCLIVSDLSPKTLEKGQSFTWILFVVGVIS